MQSKGITDHNSAERFKSFVVNDESAEIAVGTPVCFVMDGTDDGVAVVLPSTGGAAKAHSLLAGIVVEKNLPITLPKGGLVQTYGLCRTVKVVRATRAATTDSFASQLAIAIGDLMAVETVANGVTRTAAGAASGFFAGIVAAEVLASVASAASTTSETRTAITGTMKCFLRLC